MSAVKRILLYLENKGISKYKFYQDTGLSNGALDKSENLGSDKCERIIYAYPDLSPEWLLTGDGPMLRDERPASAGIPAVAPTEHARDPRDIELIATLKAMVETQKDLIVELKREKSAEGLGSGQRSAQTATYPYVGPQQTHK